MENNKAKLGGRIWLNIILFGFMGQIAWAVENMFFNTFLYNSIYNGATQEAVNGSIDVMSAISTMVAASAAFTVVATFFMGTLSDKIGKRKPFISIGYILWGIVTASFGVISRDHTAELFNLTDEVKILTVTVAMVIVMDCIMSFIGSTGNDAAFNAWVTDVTNTHNRATVESVLTLLPLVATAGVMGLAGAVESIGYDVIFIGLGAIVTLCGIIGLITIKDSNVQTEQTGSFLKDLLYGFKPSVLKENKKLYLALSANCCTATAFQVFFPYIFIYLGKVMNFSLDNVLASLTPAIMAVAAVVVIIAVAVVISAGKLMDKLGKEKFTVVSVVVYFVGLLAAGFAKNIVVFFICAVPALLGWALLGIAMNASVRDYMPEGKVGSFQGIRIIFYVLIPMIVGPFIGNIVCRFSKITYTNEYNVVTSAPGNVMFWAAAVVAVLTLIPVIILRKSNKKSAE
ncbi:MAG: MFS transporter [Clostridiales bacterium]|nr:MFS transporter [Clostridiales bacterium]